MLTQEELQATNEEFEATNEELQATNEELRKPTIEELQATNEELQTTNDELTARTGEFRIGQAARLRQLQLTTVLERYPYYVMVLVAEDLTIQTINPAYKQMLGNRDVVGLPMTEVFGGKEVDELIKILKRSVRERLPLETGPILAQVNHAEEKGIHFVHTVVPVVEASGSVATVSSSTARRPSSRGAATHSCRASGCSIRKLFAPARASGYVTDHAGNQSPSSMQYSGRDGDPRATAPTLEAIIS